MSILFSCRNCIHNGGQCLSAGEGSGYCLQHESVVDDPDTTTCKYLHRKDLPRFLVDEGIAEHAAEFVRFPKLASLIEKRPIPAKRYSEKFVWEHRIFNPVTQALSQYYKRGGDERSWHIVQSFTGGLDGLRSLAHASLVRRYMNECGSWTSSYRLVLGLLDELPRRPHFDAKDLHPPSGPETSPTMDYAVNDVLAARLSGLQEYGWHAGIEPLMWITDELADHLVEPSWDDLAPALEHVRSEWTDRIIEHARAEGEFFPAAEAAPA